MKKVDTNRDWQQSKANIFWGEIAPCDHVVQIYENDAIFLDALAGFVGGGINSGDCCIVLATDTHLQALEARLLKYGVHTHVLIANNSYIPLNAEELLSRFMVNGWPDEALFIKEISALIEKAGKGNRRIRAFGEMVAILWAQGNYGATVHLEHLWNRLCEQKSFCLFCAYPKSGFTDDINTSIMHICGAHSKMISGSEKQLTEVYYRDIDKDIEKKIA